VDTVHISENSGVMSGLCLVRYFLHLVTFLLRAAGIVTSATEVTFQSSFVNRITQKVVDDFRCNFWRDGSCDQ